MANLVLVMFPFTSRTSSMSSVAATSVCMRWVVVSAPAVPIVRIRQDGESPLVTNAWGKACHPKRLGETFARFADRHGFGVRFHGLRHTAAILMLSSGVDVRTAAGRLGHARAGFTLNVYGHFMAEADQRAAERVGEMLKG